MVKNMVKKREMSMKMRTTTRTAPHIYYWILLEKFWPMQKARSSNSRQNLREEPI